MIDVRDESPRDRKDVYQVVSSAFGRLAEAELVEKLGETGDSVVSLVADESGQIVGHVLLSRMEAPFPALALRCRSVPQDSGEALDQPWLSKPYIALAAKAGLLSSFWVIRTTTNDSVLTGRQPRVSYPHTPDAILWCSGYRHRFPPQLASCATHQRSPLLVKLLATFYRKSKPRCYRFSECLEVVLD